MQIRRLVPVLLIGLLLCFGATPAAAITHGEPDGARHPYVGTIVPRFAGQFGLLCSGTLIAPTIFLTAAHCTEIVEQPGYETFVTFASRIGPGLTLIPGTPITNPGYVLYDHPPYTSGDIGVIVLSRPVILEQYGALPTAGLLDQLADERGAGPVDFTLVGYGFTGRETPPSEPGQPQFEIPFERYTTTATLVNLRSQLAGDDYIQLSGNPSQGSGGVCYGDSGGPVLLKDTNVVVGVNSFGLSPYCTGLAFSLRTDTDTARTFLAPYVALP